MLLFTAVFLCIGNTRQKTPWCDWCYT